MDSLILFNSSKASPCIICIFSGADSKPPIYPSFVIFDRACLKRCSFISIVRIEPLVFPSNIPLNNQQVEYPTQVPTSNN